MGRSRRSRIRRHVTDESGQTVLKHANPDLKYSLYVTAPGFQQISSRAQTLSAATPLRLEMLHARPAIGTIVNRQGEPVGNAAVRELRSRRPGTTNNRSRRQALAVSDEQGRFRLTELQDGWKYDLLVEAENHAPTIIPGVQAGDTDVRVALDAPIEVSGTILGSVEELKELNRRQGMTWKLRFPALPGEDSHERLVIQDRLPWEIVEGTGGGGVGKFKLPPMASGELTLKAGGSLVKRDLTQSSRDVEIDLSADYLTKAADVSMQRAIRVVFTRDGERVSPRGLLQISLRKSESEIHEQQSFPIRNGVVETQIPTPNRLLFDCNTMIGFWFGSQGPPKRIAAGDEIFEIAIPVHPAGAAKGTIRNADGTPAVNASASVKYELDVRSDGHTSYGGGFNSRTNANGEFFVSPIPFGANCSMHVAYEKYVAIGGKFQMSAENVLPTFNIDLGEAVDARVRLLDPWGKPIVGQHVGFACRHPLAPHGWSPPEMTNAKGECTFFTLNPALKGHYVAELKFSKDYVAASVPLDLSGEVTIVRVKSGAIITGTLLNAEGKPLPGQTVVAHPVDWKPNGNLLFAYRSQAATDAQGRFRFSNLPPEKMKLQVSRWASAGVFAVPTTAGKAKPVIVRIPR